MKAEADRQRSEVERAAAEESLKKREAEDAARATEAEERAKAQGMAGLSIDENRKAEELAKWDFIKDRRDMQALGDHLARLPTGVTTVFAQTCFEELVWAGGGSSPDMSALEDNPEEFPEGQMRGNLEPTARRGAATEFVENILGGVKARQGELM